MFAASYSFAKLLHALGTTSRRSSPSWIVDNGWHCTMVLTEPDAGSDVGAGRTKASQQPDGTWHITGVKRFITSAESDMVDNIVHFVLARPEGAGVGTKGLSLFIVPKFHVDLETGELGERNGVYVTNVEKKMGLKVSTTCELTFGDEAPGRRHPARRRPRRHRPDVPHHRGRPDVRRHQGHRHPVDRLPQRPRLRQAARPGRRPHPGPDKTRRA
jgi:alkylation response protein AidB-like acyl-CoA dehydrogenase